MPHLRHRHKHHTKDNAARQAASNRDEAAREKGGGSIEIDGDAGARSGAPLRAGGLRPGVDGTYQIETARHTVSRGGGWTTNCDIQLPGKGTGQDERKAAAGTS